MIGWIHVFLVVLFLEAAIALTLSIYAWRHRSVTGATGLSGLMLCTVWWTSASILSLTSPTPTAAEFWGLPIRMIAVTLVPVFFLRFVLEYIGSDAWLQPRRFRLFFVVPLVTNLVGFLLPQLFYGAASFARFSGLWVIMTENEPVFFWVQFVHGYLLMLASFGLLLRYVVRTTGFYQRQALLLLIGALCPFIGNILAMLTGSLGRPELESLFTPLGFAPGAIIWGYALFRFRLFRLMPIAHEAIVRSMDDAVFVLDIQNRVADLNPAAAKVLRKSARDVVGQPVAVVFPRQLNLVETYIHTKEAQAEIDTPDIDGHPRYFDMRISTLYRREQQEAGRLLVLRDITARKLAELERERLIEDLDAYAHTVAHDLKTPLGMLMGYAWLLQTDDPDLPIASVQPQVTAIQDMAERMARIVDELLLFASVRRMDHVETAPMDMARIVADAQQRFVAQIVECRARVIVTGSWPPAIGYAPWVEEIWANYLSNALKYGGDPPEIHIGGEFCGSYSRFWVKDNGRGLSPEEQAAVFVKFTRFEPRRAQGNGLGLSIVQRIVDRLGGTAGVESQVGVGSTFYFTLPTHNSATEPDSA